MIGIVDYNAGNIKSVERALDYLKAPYILSKNPADLKDVDDGNLGLNGSPTKIAKASDKVRKGAGEKVTPESPEEAVAYIVGKLDEKHII